MSLVLDTGPILALLDADDPDHDRCVDLVLSARENLIVPAATLVEVDYWCRKLLGPDVFAAFVDDLALGAYQLYGLDAEGYRRAVALERRYEDLRLGVVDASVIVTCEILGETKVATLDHRLFSVVRPAHCASLTLLPS